MRSGFLNLNKPAGCSSRDVVNHVQRFVEPEKVGHAGTLDPLATGVLVVAVGSATRLIRFLHELPKSYQATFQLGCQSPSDDMETDVTPLPIPDTVTLPEIERCLASFCGEISQRPPMYSAVKVGGRRAYRLARKGVEHELRDRAIVIHDAKVISWERPYLQIDMTCSTGTYVRSVGRDLAEKLGTSAVMTALTRTAVGPFHIRDSHPPDEVTRETLLAFMVPPLAAVEHLAKRTLSESEIGDVQHGRAIPAHSERFGEAVAPVVAAIDQERQLVAILQWRPDERYWPICVLSSAILS